MSFASKVWRLLVGIKDGLSLLFLLIFFGILFVFLTARPGKPDIKTGALVINLDGAIVEEKQPIDPVELLIDPDNVPREIAVQDVIRAISTAKDDDRINSIVIDLQDFSGAGQVHLSEIGAALDSFRQAKKPVLIHAAYYDDDGMLLAAHASEVWVDPLGGAVVTGPGGSNMYFANLLDKLNINARVYKVGKYKSAVEPFIRANMSDEARENASALYGALWEDWLQDTAKARPKMQTNAVIKDPVTWVESSKGDLANAALRAGMVDKIGDWTAFANHVATIAGSDPSNQEPGQFAANSLSDWLAENPESSDGDAIGVITIAGNLVDDSTDTGTAGGERIAQLLDDALSSDLKGLVIRVDSPGGSVTASEQIRQAILRHKNNGIPIAVSMANVAASGGYWVSTPADRIFAEPATITGSIGIFGIVPTFEKLAPELGITTDGVRTSSLSGQPDLVAGFTPEMDRILQLSVEHGYDNFLTRVSQSRKLSKERVDEIGQGRVWDGGTARQLGLVDQLGGLDDALGWVAQKAGLEQGAWHAAYLGNQAPEFENLLQAILAPSEEASARGSDIFAVIKEKQSQTLQSILHNARFLSASRGMMAFCLECSASHSVPNARPMRNNDPLALVLNWLK